MEGKGMGNVRGGDFKYLCPFFTTYRILYFHAQFLNIPVFFINLGVHYVLNHHMRDDLIHNVPQIV